MPRPLPEGLDALAHAVAGRIGALKPLLPALERRAERCDALRAAMVTLDADALDARQDDARTLLRLGKGSDPAVEALAVVAVRAQRVLGIQPHPVQLVGALGLDAGLLVEMATGEGKTLTSGLAAVLAAWRGEACHLVTANDYLALRDAETLAPLYAACDVSASAVTEDQDDAARPVAYSADVVHVTGRTLLADFLKDRVAGGARARRRAELGTWLGQSPALRLRQLRGLDVVIVDEADSVLIDEAVTPLILSSAGSGRGLEDAATLASAVADGLRPGVDYLVLTRDRGIRLLDRAREALAARADALPGLWRAPARREELLRQALLVRHFHQRGRDYVVHDDAIVLLDEFTGRMTPERKLSAGLHQALEAREGVPLTAPTETLTRMSYQAFFRCFRRVSGTTGTGHESRSEFWRLYGLRLVRLPTHRPCLRTVHSAVIHADAASRWDAVIELVERVHARGQPILVGTRSVTASETLATALEARGLEFELLNAVRHEHEAEIVARAGEPGRITIATNMAGRGTDIRLAAGVEALGGLFVLGTEYNASARVDRQLAGRCARQGQQGEAACIASLDDELPERWLPSPVRALARAALARGVPAAQPLARALMRLAQRRAEAVAYQGRHGVLRTDRWLDRALPFDRR